MKAGAKDLYKLIVVDDVELIRTMLAECIQKYQPDIEIAGVFSDGETVIEYLNTNHVDIIVTDIKMPVKTGLDIAQYVNDNFPDIKVIIISAYDDFEYAKQAIKYGVFDYLKKPIDVPELLDTIERTVECLEKDDESDKINTEMVDMDRLCFWEDIVQQKKLIDIEIFKRLYPNIVADDVLITSYVLHMKSYEVFSATKWNYESEKLIEAIHGLIRLVIKDMKAIEVECINLGNDRIRIIVIGDNDTKIDYQKVSESLFSLIGLETEYSSVINSSGISDINNTVFFDLAGQATTALSEEKREIEEYIEMAKQYIQDNIENYLSREAVARFVGYSDSYFARCFKEATGTSVNKYIQNERIKRIIILLNSDMKIKDIASKMGYRDVRVLRNTFKMFVGMTPDEYRKKIMK